MRVALQEFKEGLGIIDYQPSLYASDFALRASTGQGGLTRKTYKKQVDVYRFNGGMGQKPKKKTRGKSKE